MSVTQILALAMLLGAVPVGYIAVYKKKQSNAREIGVSIDTPKIIRSLGAVGLAIVFALNLAKGFIPTYIAAANLSSCYLVILTAIIALLSHRYPYWFMFKFRDKTSGVGAGVLLALSPITAACAAGVWVFIFLILKRTSLASIIAGISVPILLKVFGAPIEYIWFGLLGCACMIVMNSSSIYNIINGTEPRFTGINRFKDNDED